ncbi:hypothetical protein PG991_010429 [Apiospora marii]|uniref:Uncharacterized protein n=1 Tax=Apiospora marii TaxID=335849 RepID=A0ABR1RKI1_9PEZI
MSSEPATLSPEVIVSLALGIPSLVVAVASLIVGVASLLMACLTYRKQNSPKPASRTSSWPLQPFPRLAQNGARDTWSSAEHSGGGNDKDPILPRAASTSWERPLRDRRTNS